MLALVQDASSEPPNGLMGLRKPNLKRTEEEGSDGRKGSHSQSNVSFKLEKEKRHHRILKQVHKPRNFKPVTSRNEIFSLDPKKSCVSLSRLMETLPDLPSGTRDCLGAGQYSMTFSSTEESVTKDRVDSFGCLGQHVVEFDPVNHELIMGKTPVSEFPGLDGELPFLDLNN
jgi:hypothetical protein